MRWFGESWGAPVCDPEFQVPVPKGEECVNCGQEIVSDDAGFIIPHLSLSELPRNRAYHRDCFLREIGAIR